MHSTGTPDLLVDHPALHQDALDLLEQADRTLALFDHNHIQDVHRFDQITPEWLTKVLGGDTSTAQVLQMVRDGGHEGMTSRHVLTITWNEAGKMSNLPTKIFVKATPANAHLLEMLSMLHMAELECKFYNIAAPSIKSLVPKTYYAKSWTGGRFIILQEVLEDRGIKPYWMGDTLSIPFARAAAVALAQAHASFWNTPRFQTDLSFIRPRCRRLGETWLETMFHRVRKNFLASEIGMALPPYVKNLVQLWDENCRTLYEYWDSKPATLVHGDSHLGNVMEFADSSAGLYDWQCFFRGYGFRDLAYFLMSGLTAEEAKEHERAIFDLYVDTLAQHDVSVDREEAWLDYTLLTLERFDSAMTSLTQGGYGHARHALERQVVTLTYVTQDRDVTQLLKNVVATGHVRGFVNGVSKHTS